MKLHVKSSISDFKSRYMCMDLTYFYLDNQMNRSEYIIIHISMIPQEFVGKYNLKEKAHNGKMFSRVNKWVYVLPQSGKIAYDALVKHLEPYGYRPSIKTPGLWTHYSWTISFTLVVHGFGVKY